MTREESQEVERQEQTEEGTAWRRGRKADKKRIRRHGKVREEKGRERRKIRYGQLAVWGGLGDWEDYSNYSGGSD